MSTPQVTWKSSHEPKFTKHLSSVNLEGDTLIQIQKCYDAIISDLFQSFSTNNRWPAYKYLTAYHNELSSFILLLDTHPKFSGSKENNK